MSKHTPAQKNMCAKLSPTIYNTRWLTPRSQKPKPLQVQLVNPAKLDLERGKLETCSLSDTTQIYNTWRK